MLVLVLLLRSPFICPSIVDGMRRYETEEYIISDAVIDRTPRRLSSHGELQLSIFEFRKSCSNIYHQEQFVKIMSTPTDIQPFFFPAAMVIPNSNSKKHSGERSNVVHSDKSKFKQYTPMNRIRKIVQQIKSCPVHTQSHIYNVMTPGLTTEPTLFRHLSTGTNLELLFSVAPVRQSLQVLCP